MTELETRLVTYIEDAHGLEQHMLRALDSLIETTNDPEIRDTLEHHKEETDLHRERLAERLQAHHATPSMVEDAGQIFVALTSGLIDRAHPRSPAKVLSDGVLAEHLEITSYELLERVARAAGDLRTAEVARRNRADEEAMVEKLRAGSAHLELKLGDERPAPRALSARRPPTRRCRADARPVRHGGVSRARSGLPAGPRRLSTSPLPGRRRLDRDAP